MNLFKLTRCDLSIYTRVARLQWLDVSLSQRARFAESPGTSRFPPEVSYLRVAKYRIYARMHRTPAKITICDEHNDTPCRELLFCIIIR